MKEIEKWDNSKIKVMEVLDYHKRALHQQTKMLNASWKAKIETLKSIISDEQLAAFETDQPKRQISTFKQPPSHKANVSNEQSTFLIKLNNYIKNIELSMTKLNRKLAEITSKILNHSNLAKTAKINQKVKDLQTEIYHKSTILHQIKNLEQELSKIYKAQVKNNNEKKLWLSTNQIFHQQFPQAHYNLDDTQKSLIQIKVETQEFQKLATNLKKGYDQYWAMENELTKDISLNKSQANQPSVKRESENSIFDQFNNLQMANEQLLAQTLNYQNTKAMNQQLLNYQHEPDTKKMSEFAKKQVTHDYLAAISHKEQKLVLIIKNLFQTINILQDAINAQQASSANNPFKQQTMQILTTLLKHVKTVISSIEPLIESLKLQKMTIVNPSSSSITDGSKKIIVPIVAKTNETSQTQLSQLANTSASLHDDNGELKNLSIQSELLLKQSENYAKTFHNSAFLTSEQVNDAIKDVSLLDSFSIFEPEMTSQNNQKTIKTKSKITSVAQTHDSKSDLLEINQPAHTSIDESEDSQNMTTLAIADNPAIQAMSAEIISQIFKSTAKNDNNQLTVMKNNYTGLIALADIEASEQNFYAQPNSEEKHDAIPQLESANDIEFNQ